MFKKEMFLKKKKGEIRVFVFKLKVVGVADVL
jgi:hypothetical protein